MKKFNELADFEILLDKDGKLKRRDEGREIPLSIRMNRLKSTINKHLAKWKRTCRMYAPGLVYKESIDKNENFFKIMPVKGQTIEIDLMVGSHTSIIRILRLRWLVLVH